MEMNVSIPVSFPDLSAFDDQSRIWLFQLDRPLSDEVCNLIYNDVKTYVDSWQSHGDKVQATTAVIANRFILLLADERNTSVGGCSTDVMMRFIQHLQAEYKVNLLDRFLVYYIDGEEILSANMHVLLQKIRNEELPADILIFDALITTKSEFDSNWVKPLNQSWVKRFL